MIGTKPYPVIILTALLMGIRCQIGDYIYGLDENKELIYWVDPMFDSEPSGHETIGQFIELCDSATDYEIGVIGANIGLNQK